jgi:hypothetical protein
MVTITEALQAIAINCKQMKADASIINQSLINPESNIYPESPKQKYLERVFLKQTEYERLITDFGEATVKEMIFRLDEYIGMKGAKYKDHNLTIRKWLRLDGNIPKPEQKAEFQPEKKIIKVTV